MHFIRPENQSEIGHRLRLLRQELRLSQKELGKKLSVSGCFLSMVENGVRQPSEHLVRLLCLTQSVNRRWLEHGRGEMFTQPVGNKPTAEEQFYDRRLMRLAFDLVAQAFAEGEGDFSVPEHAELVLNCYEKLVARKGNGSASLSDFTK